MSILAQVGAAFAQNRPSKYDLLWPLSQNLEIMLGFSRPSPMSYYSVMDLVPREVARALVSPSASKLTFSASCYFGVRAQDGSLCS